MTDGVQSFSAMLRKALGDRIVANAETFLDMVADDAVMEFPYAPPGLPKRLDGKAAITHYLTGIGDLIIFDRIGEPLAHATIDPKLIIVEFQGFGHGAATGEPYDQRYISVIRIRDGLIVQYSDYWNPLTVLRAIRGASYVDALTVEMPDYD